MSGNYIEDLVTQEGELSKGMKKLFLYMKNFIPLNK